jgi:hypothetical protein
MFTDQERNAFELGQRMARAGFSLHDNPFARLHPRFAMQWTRGVLARSALASITAAWSRDPSELPAEAAPGT